MGILPARGCRGDDGDYGDETVLLTSTQVDNDWSGGQVGLFRGNQDTNIHQFDDFKVGYDNNADGDFDDGGDVLAIDDNFGDNVTNGAISLSYDANGNLTGDGVFAFVYDAWNRLRKAKLVVGANETTIGDYNMTTTASNSEAECSLRITARREHFMLTEMAIFDSTTLDEEASAKYEMAPIRRHNSCSVALEVWSFTNQSLT